MPGWVADVAPKMVISSSQYGNPIRDRVVHQFSSVAERDATATPKVGMLCYCYTERTLYLYQWTSEWWNPGTPLVSPQWVVYDTGWVPWDARVWSGPTTMWAADDMNAAYRRTLGACDVFVQATGVGITATVDNDLIYVPLPVPTPVADVKGSFGTAQIHDPVAGVLGPLGMFDATRLAVGLLHTEGTGVADHTNLVVRGDLSDTTGAKLNLYMSGSYPCVFV